MNQKNKYKYAFLDIWETLLFSNNDDNLNFDRANIICKITNYKTPEFWHKYLENEISLFKRLELNGLSISPQKRIRKILSENYLDIYLTQKILDEFDKVFINRYIPTLNIKLLNELIQNDYQIILISNTGLITKNAIITVLKKYDIEYKFKDMFFSQDYDICKPNPLFFKLPIDKYKIKINEIIMYGDSKIMDLKPCNNLGIRCIINNWKELQ